MGRAFPGHYIKYSQSLTVSERFQFLGKTTGDANFCKSLFWISQVWCWRIPRKIEFVWFSLTPSRIGTKKSVWFNGCTRKNLFTAEKLCSKRRQIKFGTLKEYIILPLYKYPMLHKYLIRQMQKLTNLRGTYLYYM